MRRARSITLALALVASLPACGRISALRGALADAGPSATVPELPPGATPVNDAPKAGPVQGLPPPTTAHAPMLAGAPMSFAPLVKAADASVVTITTIVEQRTPYGRRMVGEGLGTGFVYDKAGFILTNNHVVEGGVNISVKLADGRELPAKVVGRDHPTDVAVVKIEAGGDLAALPLGDSDQIEVGDWVVAIGNPFGLSHTVSAGILSARGRTNKDLQGLDESGYFNFLQTDAAINQGNSGGPLLDMRGEVIGINSAIRANANNIGFAIPIAMVKQLLPILLREGKITRSALGIQIEPVDETTAVRLRLADRKGAAIVFVAPGGGADRAGLAPDDVILEFDGHAIESPDQLRWLASIAGVGKQVPVRVRRGERVFDTKVTLGHLPTRDDP